MKRKFNVSALLFSLTFSMSIYAQSIVDEAGNEFIANMAVMVHGSELGHAEGCQFEKTGEYFQRFKKAFFEMKVATETKNALWKQFELYRQESKGQIHMVDMKERGPLCEDAREAYTDSTLWNTDWSLGVN